MSLILIKLVISIIGIALAGGSFWWNGNMPDPVGPVPFFAGIGLFLFAIILL